MDGNHHTTYAVITGYAATTLATIAGWVPTLLGAIASLLTIIWMLLQISVHPRTKELWRKFKK